MAFLFDPWEGLNSKSENGDEVEFRVATYRGLLTIKIIQAL